MANSIEDSDLDEFIVLDEYSCSHGDHHSADSAPPKDLKTLFIKVPKVDITQYGGSVPNSRQNTTTCHKKMEKRRLNRIRRREKLRALGVVPSTAALPPPGQSPFIFGNEFKIPKRHANRTASGSSISDVGTPTHNYPPSSGYSDDWVVQRDKSRHDRERKSDHTHSGHRKRQRLCSSRSLLASKKPKGKYDGDRCVQYNPVDDRSVYAVSSSDASSPVHGGSLVEKCSLKHYDLYRMDTSDIAPPSELCVSDKDKSGSHSKRTRSDSRVRFDLGDPHSDKRPSHVGKSHSDSKIEKSQSNTEKSHSNVQKSHSDVEKSHLQTLKSHSSILKSHTEKKSHSSSHKPHPNTERSHSSTTHKHKPQLDTSAWNSKKELVQRERNDEDETKCKKTPKLSPVNSSVSSKSSNKPSSHEIASKKVTDQSKVSVITETMETSKQDNSSSSSHRKRFDEAISIDIPPKKKVRLKCETRKRESSQAIKKATDCAKGTPITGTTCTSTGTDSIPVVETDSNNKGPDKTIETFSLKHSEQSVSEKNCDSEKSMEEESSTEAEKDCQLEKEIVEKDSQFEAEHEVEKDCQVEKEFQEQDNTYKNMLLASIKCLQLELEEDNKEKEGTIPVLSLEDEDNEVDTSNSMLMDTDTDMVTTEMTSVGIHELSTSIDSDTSNMVPLESVDNTDPPVDDGDQRVNNEDTPIASVDQGPSVSEQLEEIPLEEKKEEENDGKSNKKVRIAPEAEVIGIDHICTDNYVPVQLQLVPVKSVLKKNHDKPILKKIGKYSKKKRKELLRHLKKCKRRENALKKREKRQDNIPRTIRRRKTEEEELYEMNPMLFPNSLKRERAPSLRAIEALATNKMIEESTKQSRKRKQEINLLAPPGSSTMDDDGGIKKKKVMEEVEERETDSEDDMMVEETAIDTGNEQVMNEKPYTKRKKRKLVTGNKPYSIICRSQGCQVSQEIQICHRISQKSPQFHKLITNGPVPVDSCSIQVHKRRFRAESEWDSIRASLTSTTPKGSPNFNDQIWVMHDPAHSCSRCIPTCYTISRLLKPLTFVKSVTNVPLVPLGFNQLFKTLHGLTSMLGQLECDHHSMYQVNYLVLSLQSLQQCAYPILSLNRLELARSNTIEPIESCGEAFFTLGYLLIKVHTCLANIHQLVEGVASFERVKCSVESCLLVSLYLQMYIGNHFELPKAFLDCMKVDKCGLVNMATDPSTFVFNDEVQPFTEVIGQCKEQIENYENRLDEAWENQFNIYKSFVTDLSKRCKTISESWNFRVVECRSARTFYDYDEVKKHQLFISESAWDTIEAKKSFIRTATSLDMLGLESGSTKTTPTSQVDSIGVSFSAKERSTMKLIHRIILGKLSSMIHNHRVQTRAPITQEKIREMISVIFQHYFKRIQAQILRKNWNQRLEKFGTPPGGQEKTEGGSSMPSQSGTAVSGQVDISTIRAHSTGGLTDISTMISAARQCIDRLSNQREQTTDTSSHMTTDKSHMTSNEGHMTSNESHMTSSVAKPVTVHPSPLLDLIKKHKDAQTKLDTPPLASRVPHPPVTPAVSVPTPVVKAKPISTSVTPKTSTASTIIKMSAVSSITKPSAVFSSSATPTSRVNTQSCTVSGKVPCSTVLNTVPTSSIIPLSNAIPAGNLQLNSAQIIALANKLLPLMGMAGNTTKHTPTQSLGQTSSGVTVSSVSQFLSKLTFLNKSGNKMSSGNTVQETVSRGSSVAKSMSDVTVTSRDVTMTTDDVIKTTSDVITSNDVTTTGSSICKTKSVTSRDVTMTTNDVTRSISDVTKNTSDVITTSSDVITDVIKTTSDVTAANYVAMTTNSVTATAIATACDVTKANDVTTTTNDVTTTTNDVTMTTNDVTMTTNDATATANDVIATTRDVTMTRSDVISIPTVLRHPSKAVYVQALTQHQSTQYPSCKPSTHQGQVPVPRPSNQPPPLIHHSPFPSLGPRPPQSCITMTPHTGTTNTSTMAESRMVPTPQELLIQLTQHLAQRYPTPVNAHISIPIVRGISQASQGTASHIVSLLTNVYSNLRPPGISRPPEVVPGSLGVVPTPQTITRPSEAISMPRVTTRPPGIIHQIARPLGVVPTPQVITRPPGVVPTVQITTRPPALVPTAHITRPPGVVPTPQVTTRPPGGISMPRVTTRPPEGIFTPQVTTRPPGEISRPRVTTRPPGGIFTPQVTTRPPGEILHFTSQNTSPSEIVSLPKNTTRPLGTPQISGPSRTDHDGCGQSIVRVQLNQTTNNNSTPQSQQDHAHTQTSLICTGTSTVTTSTISVQPTSTETNTPKKSPPASSSRPHVSPSSSAGVSVYEGVAGIPDTHQGSKSKKTQGPVDIVNGIVFNYSSNTPVKSLHDYVKLYNNRSSICSVSNETTKPNSIQICRIQPPHSTSGSSHGVIAAVTTKSSQTSSSIAAPISGNADHMSSSTGNASLSADQIQPPGSASSLSHRVIAAVSTKSTPVEGSTMQSLPCSEPGNDHVQLSTDHVSTLLSTSDSSHRSITSVTSTAIASTPVDGSLQSSITVQASVASDNDNVPSSTGYVSSSNDLKQPPNSNTAGLSHGAVITKSIPVKGSLQSCSTVQCSVPSGNMPLLTPNSTSTGSSHGVIPAVPTPIENESSQNNTTSVSGGNDHVPSSTGRVQPPISSSVSSHGVTTTVLSSTSVDGSSQSSNTVQCSTPCVSDHVSSSTNLVSTVSSSSSTSGSSHGGIVTISTAPMTSIPVDGSLQSSSSIVQRSAPSENDHVSTDQIPSSTGSVPSSTDHESNVHVPSSTCVPSSNNSDSSSTHHVMSSTKHVSTDHVPSPIDHAVPSSTARVSSNPDNSSLTSNTVKPRLTPTEILLKARVANASKSIILEWEMADSTSSPAMVIEKFNISYAKLPDTSNSQFPSDWSSIGTVQALKLPMSATLANLQTNQCYLFLVKGILANGEVVYSNIKVVTSKESANLT